MIAKLTKEVTERLKAFRSLRAAFAEQGPEVAAAVEGLAPPANRKLAADSGTDGPEDQGTVLATFETFGRSLQGSIDQVVAFDRQLFDLSSEESALRKIRDDALGFLGQRVVGLRRTVLGQYVDPNLDALGLRPPNPTEPLAFHRNVELIVGKLGGEDRHRLLGASLFETAHDPGVHTAELQGPNQRLGEALTGLATLKRRIDAVLVKKYAVLETYDREELRASRMFEDLCHFAGKPELAVRVRPTERRVRKDEGELVFTDQVIDDQAPAGGESAVAEPANDQPAADATGTSATGTSATGTSETGTRVA